MMHDQAADVDSAFAQPIKQIAVGGLQRVITRAGVGTSTSVTAGSGSRRRMGMRCQRPEA